MGLRLARQMLLGRLAQLVHLALSGQQAHHRQVLLAQQVLPG